MYQFDLTEWPKEHVWQWLKEKTATVELVAVPFRKVLALGTLDGIRDAFKDLLVEPVARVPIDDRDIRYDDGAVTCLLRRALVRSMAKKHDLVSNGDSLIWEANPYTREKEAGVNFPVHRRLESAFVGSAAILLTIDPTVEVDGDKELAKDAIRNIRQRILGYQHNREYNAELNRWRENVLIRKEPTEFDFPLNSGAFRFVVRSAPMFAEVSQGNRPAITIPANFTHLDYQKGFVVPEPLLLFGGGQSERPATDPLPLRGLANFGPFDSADQRQLVLRAVWPSELFVPGPKAPPCWNTFSRMPIAHRAVERSTEEYMVRYPGFDVAYRVALEIPGRTAAGWQTLQEVTSGLDVREGALQLSRNIRDAVSSLVATGCRIVLIFTPARWSKWRGFDLDDESFDVHDFVKAGCVKQGIASQFLDQDTLDYPDKCRIWWWFSVALLPKLCELLGFSTGLTPSAHTSVLDMRLTDMLQKGGMSFLDAVICTTRRARDCNSVSRESKIPY